ncbi:MAG: sigma-70 family RNA polymerase sigma factor [Gemmatimonadota bacterium]
MDFEAAFVEHYAGLFRYLARLVGDEDAAADLAQEAFVRLLKHPLPDAEARAWLFRVATNLARDMARRRKRHRRLLEGADLRPAGSPAPDEVEERNRRVEAVRAALDTLAPRDRALLLMREEGFRYSEMAEAVGVAPGSVGTLLARALRRFAAAYGERPVRKARPETADLEQAEP